MPAISPENAGTPLTAAIPKHSGTATKNTTSPAGRSVFMCDRYFFIDGFIRIE
jgi:hypothetical protein